MTFVGLIYLYCARNTGKKRIVYERGTVMPTLLEERQEYEKKVQEYEKERTKDRAEYYSKYKNYVETAEYRVEELIKVTDSSKLKGKVTGFTSEKEEISLDKLEINSELDYFGSNIEPARVSGIAVKQAAEFYDSIFYEVEEYLDEKDFTIEKDGKRVSVYSLVRAELEKINTDEDLTDEKIAEYTKAYIVHFLMYPDVKLCYNPVQGIKVSCDKIPVAQAKRTKKETLNKEFEKEMKALSSDLESVMPKKLARLSFFKKAVSNKEIRAFDLSSKELEESEDVFNELFESKNSKCRHILDDFKIIEKDEKGGEYVFSVREVVAHELRESNTKADKQQFEQLCKAYILLAAIKKEPEIHYNMDKWVVTNDVPVLKKNAFKEGITIGGANGIETRKERIAKVVEGEIKKIKTADFMDEIKGLEVVKIPSNNDIEKEKVTLKDIEKAVDLFNRLYAGPMKEDEFFVEKLEITGEAGKLFDSLEYEDPYKLEKNKKDNSYAYKKVCVLRALTRGEKVKYDNIELQTYEISEVTRDRKFVNELRESMKNVNYQELYKLPMNSMKLYNIDIDPFQFSEEELKTVENHFDTIFKNVITLMKSEKMDILKSFFIRKNNSIEDELVVNQVDRQCKVKEKQLKKTFSDEEKRQISKLLILHSIMNPGDKVYFIFQTPNGNMVEKPAKLRKAPVPDEYLIPDFVNKLDNWLDVKLPTEAELNDDVTDRGFSRGTVKKMEMIRNYMVNIQSYCNMSAEEDRDVTPRKVYENLLLSHRIKLHGDLPNQDDMDYMQVAANLLKKIYTPKMNKGERNQLIKEISEFLPKFQDFYNGIPGMEKFDEPEPDKFEIRKAVEAAQLQRSQEEQRIRAEGEKLGIRDWNENFSVFSAFSAEKIADALSKEDRDALLKALRGQDAPEEDFNAVPNLFVAFCIGEKEIPLSELKELGEDRIGELVNEFKEGVFSHPFRGEVSPEQMKASREWYGTMYGKAMKQLADMPFQTGLKTADGIAKAAESGKIFSFFVALGVLNSMPMEWKKNVDFKYALNKYVETYRLERAAEVEYSYQRAIVCASDPQVPLNKRVLHKLMLELEYEPGVSGKSFADLSSTDNFDCESTIALYFNNLDSMVQKTELQGLTQEECNKLLNTPMEELRKTDVLLYNKALKELKSKFPNTKMIGLMDLAGEKEIEEAKKEEELKKNPPVQNEQPVIQSGKDWDNYQEAMKNLQAYESWILLFAAKLKEVEESLSETRLIPVRNSSAEKMMNAIKEAKQMLGKGEVKRKDLNTVLLNLYQSADEFRKNNKDRINEKSPRNRRVWLNNAKECMDLARKAKMSSETIWSWIKKAPLKTTEGKSFKEASSADIMKTISEKKEHYMDQTNYKNDPEIRQLAWDADIRADLQLGLFLRMGKDNGRLFNFNGLAGDPDKYMIPKKNPSTKDLAKEYLIKQYCAEILSKENVRNSNMFTNIEKNYLDHFKTDAEKLAKDPVFKGFCRIHTGDIYSAWNNVLSNAEKMKNSFQSFVNEVQNTGYADYVMANAYTARKEDEVITVYRLKNKENAYFKLSYIVLGQIMQEPGSEHFLKGIVSGQYDLSDMISKTSKFLMDKKVIPQEVIKPSKHTGRKQLEEAITSGKLKNDVLKKVLMKQKMIKITEKPSQEGVQNKVNGAMMAV